MSYMPHESNTTSNPECLHAIPDYHVPIWISNLANEIVDKINCDRNIPYSYEGIDYLPVEALIEIIILNHINIQYGSEAKLE